MVRDIRSFASKFEPWWTLVGAPISQEFIFRYIPYQIYLSKGHLLEIGLLSAILYGLIHWYFGWKATIFLMLFGVLQWLIIVKIGFVAVLFSHVILNIIILTFWRKKWMTK